MVRRRRPRHLRPENIRLIWKQPALQRIQFAMCRTRRCMDWCLALTEEDARESDDAVHSFPILSTKKTNTATFVHLVTDGCTRLSGIFGWYMAAFVCSVLVKARHVLVPFRPECIREIRFQCKPPTLHRDLTTIATTVPGLGVVLCWFVWRSRRLCVPESWPNFF
jgi:hypothetical protein